MARGKFSDKRVVPYTLRIEIDRRILRTTETREPFVANFNGSGGDLLHAISSFVEALPADSLVERDLRHFGQPTDVLRKGRTISWRMDGGESGRTTLIKLRKKARTRQRDASGVEWAPFWVCAVVPTNANHGWLLVEKDGNHTLPTEWRKELCAQFARAYHGYRLVIGTVREESLWSQVENALDDGRLMGFEVSFRSEETTKVGAAGYEMGMAKTEKQIWRATADRPASGRALRSLRREHTRNLTSGGLQVVEAPIEVNDLADERFKIRLRDDVEEIRAHVLNGDGVQKTVVFEGLDPQQTIVISDSSAGPITQDRFTAECHSAVKDLATSGGVSLPPGWNTKKWKHPANAVTMEVVTDEPPATDEDTPAG